MNIGGTIKELRKKKGIKLGVFAELVGISATSMGQIEKNNPIPKTTTLNSICEQLNITTELLYLLSINEENIPESNKEKYRATFPTIRNLMVEIFSEDDEKELI